MNPGCFSYEHDVVGMCNFGLCENVVHPKTWTDSAIYFGAVLARTFWFLFGMDVSLYFLDDQESNKEGHPDTSPSGSLRFSIDMAAIRTRCAQTPHCSPPYKSAMLGWL